MMENLPVRVEVWPVAADPIGLWLLSGPRPWLSPNVRAGSEPHDEVKWMLSLEALAANQCRFVHSTSWRMDGPALIVTYVAVIEPSDFGPAQWPGAVPITEAMAEHVGPALAGPPLSPPSPRHIDVLLHALRHLRFLLDHDMTARTALGENWAQHLQAFDPTLAGMYGS